MNKNRDCVRRKVFCARLRGGFTLMEVLTVVLIIGILSSVALPQYRKVVEKGKFTKAQVMAKAMYDSCERLVAEWGADSYSTLPSDVQNAGIARLDMGSTDDLPAGFTASGKVLSGAGFTYTLQNDCEIKIVKNEGSYKANLTFDGTGFTCSNVDEEACAIYGLD